MQSVAHPHTEVQVLLTEEANPDQAGEVWRAVVLQMPHLKAEGESREQALSAIKDLLSQSVRHAEVITLALANGGDTEETLVNAAPAENMFEGKFAPSINPPDPTPSAQWLREHSTEFAGQYVALDGDRLIAHSANAAEVVAAVRSTGLRAVFFTLIPPADALPFAGF